MLPGKHRLYLPKTYHVRLRATPLVGVRAVEEVPVAVTGHRVLARLIPTRYLLWSHPGQ